MKIALVTDDGQTISAHFGRATKYAVVTVEDGQVVASELRDKAGHRDFQGNVQFSHDDHDHEHGHGHGQHSAEKHRIMFAAIPDCQVLLARGMGQGAYQGAMQADLQPILTQIKTIDEAVQAVIDGTIEDHPERLH
ncbi:MAG: NifB/NifX family molybdenum-iron cluster-binding protein [Candidatus Promineifilaceae bacterium]